MRSLIAATVFPDKYHPTMAPWSKREVDSLVKYTDIEVEVISPKPFSIPIKGIPFHEFGLLPKYTISELNYKIHYPRYFYFLPKSLLFSTTGTSYSFFISKYISKNIQKPDVIHARFGYLDGYGVLKTCKKNNIPLVFDIHGGKDFGEFNTKFGIKYKHRKTIDYTSKFFCVAEWQIDEGKKLGIPDEKLICVPLGIDIDKFNPRNKNDLRKEYNIDKDFVFIFVGNLIPRKGVNYLIEAISKIDEKLLKNAGFFIVGDGSDRDTLEKMVNNLELKDFITFLGRIDEDDLLNWYSLSDIFILPSLAEGRPTVINEAMACECGVIATNVSGNPEQVIEAYNGTLIDAKSSDQIAERITSLLQNPDIIKKFIRNSRKSIIERGLTWDHYAKTIEEIYKEIL